MQNNDRYEFPLELDLDRDNYKYLTEDADRSIRNKYVLHRQALAAWAHPLPKTSELFGSGGIGMCAV